MTPSQNTLDYETIALKFTEALARRDYETAYRLTTPAYQAQIGRAEFQAAFEAIVPLDWGDIGPIEMGETMTDWPGKAATEISWVYVSIGGDVYSEAVTLLVTQAGDGYQIGEVEFGRP